MIIIKGEKGVTLIELMIVVVCVGILAAVAIPAYNDYITRSRRSDAFTALQTVRAAQEMYRAERGEYRNTADFNANLLPGCSQSMAGSNYTLAVARPTATTFTVTATALASGKQASDKYSQFRVNQDGLQEYYNSSDATWYSENSPYPNGKKWEDLR
jgi:type IV pilus assembly protein PilE